MSKISRQPVFIFIAFQFYGYRISQLCLTYGFLCSRINNAVIFLLECNSTPTPHLKNYMVQLYSNQFCHIYRTLADADPRQRRSQDPHHSAQKSSPGGTTGITYYGSIQYGTANDVTAGVRQNRARRAHHLEPCKHSLWLDMVVQQRLPAFQNY